MLKIDRLTVHLPPGRHKRAGHIVRDAARWLAEHQPPSDMSIDCMAVPTIKIGDKTSDAELARCLAHSLREGISSAAGRNGARQ